MKKVLSILSLVLVLVLTLGLTACGGDTDTASTPSTDNSSVVDTYTPVDMTVACMTGPTGVGMAKLMADSEAKTTANNYTFTVASAATEINAKFLKGEINIASVPTNVAATLYNKTNGKVRMLAVNTYGVLSILEKGDTVKSVADLRARPFTPPVRVRTPSSSSSTFSVKTDSTPKRMLPSTSFRAKSWLPSLSAEKPRSVLLPSLPQPPLWSKTPI